MVSDEKERVSLERKTCKAVHKHKKIIYSYQCASRLSLNFIVGFADLLYHALSSFDSKHLKSKFVIRSLLIAQRLTFNKESVKYKN